MTFPSGFELIFVLLIVLGLLAALVWFVIFSAVRAGKRR